MTTEESRQKVARAVANADRSAADAFGARAREIERAVLAATDRMCAAMRAQKIAAIEKKGQQKNDD